MKKKQLDFMTALFEDSMSFLRLRQIGMENVINRLISKGIYTSMACTKNGTWSIRLDEKYSPSLYCHFHGEGVDFYSAMWEALMGLAESKTKE